MHACQLITTRPLDVHGLFDAMYCLQKLLRQDTIRDRLQKRMVQMAVQETRDGGTAILLPPPRLRQPFGAQCFSRQCYVCCSGVTIRGNTMCAHGCKTSGLPWRRGCH